jgi:hypothetical protein
MLFRIALTPPISFELPLGAKTMWAVPAALQMFSATS